MNEEFATNLEALEAIARGVSLPDGVRDVKFGFAPDLDTNSDPQDAWPNGTVFTFSDNPTSFLTTCSPMPRGAKS